MTGEKQPVSPGALRQVAALAGLALSEAELEQLAPQVEIVLEGLRRLEELDLQDVEPATIHPLPKE